MHQVDHYIAEVADAQGADQVLAALGTQVTRLGFEWFTYEMVLSPTNQHDAFSSTNFPTLWIDQYARQRYTRDDPVISHAMRMSRPFLWDEIRRHPHLTLRQKTIFNEAADVGLTAGAIVPLHGPGPIKAYVSVTSNMPDDRFAQLFARCRHELLLLATYAHAQLVKLGVGAPMTSLSLSPREIEVMTWTALGYSAWDIAEKLSISAHTVKEHIDRSKEKLGAKNKTHAASICISQGLVRL